MRFDQFKSDWMKVNDENGDLEFETYCPDRLRSYIANAPKNGVHIIAKNLREPVGYSAVEKPFRA